MESDEQAKVEGRKRIVAKSISNSFSGAKRSQNDPDSSSSGHVQSSWGVSSIQNMSEAGDENGSVPDLSCSIEEKNSLISQRAS